jgi:hypothetical protein
MIDWNKFSFEGLSDYDISLFKKETSDKCYEKFFEVEQDDIVVDIGAFYGTFTYSILDKKPKHCWCLEPIEKNFKILKNNLMGHPVSFIRGAISDKANLTLKWDDNQSYAPGLNFKKFITDNCIDNIDFLKVDCEGGEYLIFTEENIKFLKNNVKKIAGEFHLDGAEFDNNERSKDFFRNFRDNILVQFKNYHIYSYDYVDITWDLFNEHFLEYYKEVYVYIDNR